MEYVCFYLTESLAHGRKGCRSNETSSGGDDTDGGSMEGYPMTREYGHGVQTH